MIQRILLRTLFSSLSFLVLGFLQLISLNGEANENASIINPNYEASILGDFNRWVDSQKIKNSRFRDMMMSNGDQINTNLSSRTTVKSLCLGNSVSLNIDQQKIERCLAIITEDANEFVKEAISKGNSGETRKLCGTYVSDAAEKTHWTRDRPTGCLGYEKANHVLKSDPQFVDIAPYLQEFLKQKVVGAEAQTHEGLVPTLMVPPGSLLSFTGNNPGKKSGCSHGKKMGHFTAKVSGQGFCHFRCDICPAAKNRQIDKILVKVRREYRYLFRAGSGLDPICNDILKSDQMNQRSRISPVTTQ